MAENIPDLSPLDKELFWTLANDSEDRVVLLERAAKHESLKDKHPMVKQHLLFQNQVGSHTNELKSKVEELEKRLKERDSTDTYQRQRESLRKAPFNFNDQKIAKFEERLKEDKDLPGFPEIDSKGKTYYQNLAEYIRQQDNPLPPSSVNFQMPGVPQNTSDEPWRKSMESTKREENPLLMSRKERKKMARSLWNEALQETQERLGMR